MCNAIVLCPAPGGHERVTCTCTVERSILVVSESSHPKGYLLRCARVQERIGWGLCSHESISKRVYVPNIDSRPGWGNSPPTYAPEDMRSDTPRGHAARAGCNRPHTEPQRCVLGQLPGEIVSWAGCWRRSAAQRHWSLSVKVRAANGRSMHGLYIAKLTEARRNMRRIRFGRSIMDALYNPSLRTSTPHSYARVSHPPDACHSGLWVPQQRLSSQRNIYY
jgi:hypothetical protein